MVISLFWAIILPSVGTSIYFYSPTAEENIDAMKNQNEIIIKHEIELSKNEDSVKASRKFSANRAVQLFWFHLKMAYTNQTVIQWSIWWALASCGFSQVNCLKTILLIKEIESAAAMFTNTNVVYFNAKKVQLYIQFLWQQTNPEHENVYNGAVEAMLTLLGALGAISAGYLDSKKYEKWNLWILTVCSALEGFFLLWAALTNSIWISYVMYVLFGILFHFMITVAR